MIRWRIDIETQLTDINLLEQVRLSDQRFSLTIEDAVVEIRLSNDKRQRFDMRCNRCNQTCVHQGAALSLILEEKLSLGLSAPPPERTPIESLNETELIAQAIAERAQRARDEKMRLQSMDARRLWTDYVATNRLSGKSYRVALRGWQPGESYCTCPDFRKNTLGTCKHILYVLERGRAKFSKRIQNTPAVVNEISLYPVIECVAWDLIILDEGQRIKNWEAKTSRIIKAAGMEALKRRMEILLGARPEAPEDESMKTEAEISADTFSRREKVAAASGQLVQAAFSFIGEIFAKQESSDGNDPLSEAFKKKLNESLERTADGRLSMTITLPDQTFIDTMAKSLAGIVRLGTTASP